MKNRVCIARLDGIGVTANALHPGFVATEIYRGDEWLLRLRRRCIRRMAVSLEGGAQASIHLAAAPEMAGATGKYYKEKQEVPSAPRSSDVEAARRLWQVCGDRTGV